ncbi:inter-alpha-trypsin inhibitor heavy chain H4-like isoform X2 [Monodelphis domestica]|uniref:inter-alpha-trypsin inhibitor heavy chain H4-like isoform X2 n=1 Tax=Monodelphis domestica TaxID=13616 RepID=UPI0024E22877|nr:inter-alpha-trypsin inhibitor heavy chain H4-like isoform X2 [Monodelphis domestica]
MKILPKDINGSTPSEDGIEIYSFTMDTRIISRFARTTITSHVVNRAKKVQQATFQVEMPPKAFITNFSMIIDGVTYPGKMKEKAAMTRGQRGRVIETTEKRLEQFHVSVNVDPAANATFELVYEELLKRHLGKYELMLMIQPKQLVKQLQVDIYIFEPQGISSLENDITFMTKKLEDALTKTQNKTEVHIAFKPSLAQQQKEPWKLNTVVDGKFIVRYDVDRVTTAGDIQIENGYFVHNFAPTQLPMVPKNIVFLIDKSGSMAGRKIKKTKAALIKILDDLKPEDHFNMITFSGHVTRWKPELVLALDEHLKEAKTFLSNTPALGVTNVNGAVLAAVSMLDESNKKKELPEGSVSMIILLTDGDSTEGETKLQKIHENVKAAIRGQYHLFCLGFGFDINYVFLERLALDNGGMARHIFEGLDAELQLQDFYQEVANPLLTQVEFQYSDHAVELLTKDSFGIFFRGSELVVAGKLKPQAQELFSAHVRGKSNNQTFTFQTQVNTTSKEKVFQSGKNISHSFMERLWAYLTIQQLQEKVVLASGTELQRLEARAVNLSLNFNFLTPFTNLIVNKPKDQDQPQLAEKPVEIDHEKLKIEQTRPGRLRFQRKRIMMQPPTEPKSALLGLEARLPSLEEASPTSVSSAESLRSKERAPHFMLALITPNADSKEFLCVDIKGSPYRSLSLISDPVQGIEVTGKYKDFMDTFSWIQVSYRSPEVQVYVTQNNIAVIRGHGQGRESTSYQWHRAFYVGLNGLKMTLENRVLLLRAPQKVTIGLVSLNNHIPELRLFLLDPGYFSEKVSGVLGQFYQDLYCSSLANNKLELKVMGNTYTITKKFVVDYQDGGESASMPRLLCWSLEHSFKDGKTS